MKGNRSDETPGNMKNHGALSLTYIAVFRLCINILVGALAVEDGKRVDVRVLIAA